MDKEELIARTRRFAVLVFKLCERFPRNQSAKVVTYQLLKSASSVAANYRAVNMAKSDADFVNKLKIVLEEADESNFWLTFLSDVDLVKEDDKDLRFLVAESKQFIAIFTASVKTMNNRLIWHVPNFKFQISNLKLNELNRIHPRPPNP